MRQPDDAIESGRLPGAVALPPTGDVAALQRRLHVAAAPQDGRRPRPARAQSKQSGARLPHANDQRLQPTLHRTFTFASLLPVHFRLLAKLI